MEQAQSHKYFKLLSEDQDCRERNEPFPQIRNYLNFRTDNGLVPNRLYNAPTFYLHIGNRVINATHDQSFTPSFNEFFKFSNLSMKLNRKTIEVRGFEDDVEYKIHKFDVKRHSIGTTCTRDIIDWCEHRIDVNSNRKIHDRNTRRNVKVLLNGEPITSYRVKQMRVCKDRLRPAVLVLFENQFMASGHIELGEEVICRLQEIPGTYGTAEFVCDTKFRALLRRCEPVKRPPRQDFIPIRFYKNLLRHVTAKFENTIDARMEQNKVHTEQNALLLAVCPYFSSFFRVFQCYQRQETDRYLPNNDFWSAREKLVYLSMRLENEVVAKQIFAQWEAHDFKTQCEEGEPCLYIQRLIRLGVFFADQTEDAIMPKDILAEFMYQLHVALSALWLILDSDVTENQRMLGETFKMTVSFHHLYQSSPENILRCFPYLPNNRLRKLFLDVILAKADEHVFNEAIAVYSEYPDIVMTSLMKHPYHVLFGVDKILLPQRLLVLFAGWMEGRNGSSKRFPELARRSEGVPSEYGGAQEDVRELSEDDPRRAQEQELELSDDEPEVIFYRPAPEQSVPRRVIMDNEVVEVLAEQKQEVQMEQEEGEELFAHPEPEHVAPEEQKEQEEVLMEHPEALEEHMEPTEPAEQSVSPSSTENAEQDQNEPVEQPGAPNEPTDAPEHQDAHYDDPYAEQVLFEHPATPRATSPMEQDAPTSEQEGNEHTPAPEELRNAPSAEQDESELMEQSPPAAFEAYGAYGAYGALGAPEEHHYEHQNTPTPEPEDDNAPGPSCAPGSRRNLFGRLIRTTEPEESDDYPSNSPTPEAAPEAAPDEPEEEPEQKPEIKFIPVRKRRFNVLELCMSPVRSESPEYRRPRLPPPPEVVTPQRSLRGKIESPMLLKHVFSKK